IMKRIMALNSVRGVSFMQFSGDLINGYLNTTEETDLQYANWKRSIESFAHYFPVYISMGNHEALMRTFSDGKKTYLIDRFPYDDESAEAVFNRNFVNPTNGPESEDGASYDPNPDKMDFPPYKENVFYYTYDNVAVVVMNSDYFYAPSTPVIPVTSGGLHGYIMDQQLAWFHETIEKLENDANIDHVFITQHTPFFPNGGHVRDDMWYGGKNRFRPYVAGKPLSKGIIERRDELLDIIVNKSSKVIAILTGDEHNYARTEIGPETNIYPEGYQESKVELSRTIYQINNGAAGAPYYSQEQTPWTPKVSGFTTQNALVFFHINGRSIEMEVRNPDTLEEVDKLTIR
ncbi:MAG: metallophosphoesterase, partial [Bacteroidota bacterium]